VAARRGTRASLVGRFVQRHRFGLAAGALVVASLSAGLVSSPREYRRAEQHLAEVRSLANSFLREAQVLMRRHTSIWEEQAGAATARGEMPAEASVAAASAELELSRRASPGPPRHQHCASAGTWVAEAGAQLRASPPDSSVLRRLEPIEAAMPSCEAPAGHPGP